MSGKRNVGLIQVSERLGSRDSGPSRHHRRSAFEAAAGGDSVSLEPSQQSYEDNNDGEYEREPEQKQKVSPAKGKGKKSPGKKKKSRLFMGRRSSTTTTTVDGGPASGHKTRFKGERSSKSVDPGSGSGTGDDDNINDENVEPYQDERSDEEDDISQEKVKTSSALLLGNGHQESTSLIMEQGAKSSRNIFNLTVYQPPILRTQEEIDALDKILYVPSTAPVPIEEKLARYKTPRNPEDEGLFHGEPIHIASRNQNRLEQRIMKENQLAWFGQDGRMSAIPDPRRQKKERHFYDETIEEAFQKRLRFVPAKVDLTQRFQFDSTATYELAVDISTIVFTHHPSFSKEHVLAYKLDALYMEYKKREELGTTERVKNRLKALREVLTYIKSVESELRQKIGDGLELTPEEEAQLAQSEDRLVEYRREMRQARLDRDQSLWDDRNSLISTLDTWKSLKSLRAHQEYTNTTLKLNIITVQENMEAENTIWVDELNQEFEDVKDEFDAEYEVEYKMYQKEIKLWNEQMRNRKDDEEDADVSQEENEDDDAVQHATAIPVKPDPPAKFDAKRTKDEISKRFHQLNRLPGEPRIILEMATIPITPTHELVKETAEAEIQRRTILESSQLKIRLHFNAKEVYRSQPRELRSDFTVSFGIIVPIVVNEWPRSLGIMIWEYGTLGKRFLGEINLTIPDSQSSIESCQTERIAFKSEVVIKMSSSAGVGTGTPFDILGMEYEGISTTGFASIRVGWSQDERGRLLAPKHVTGSYHHLTEATHIIGDQYSSVQQQQQQLDPNDPKNARWLSVHEPIRQISGQDEESYQDDPSQGPDKLSDGGLMREFDFCTMEELENANRFRLLQLRDEQVPEYKNYKMVAPFDEDIPAYIFKDQRQKVEKHEDSQNRLVKIREMRRNIMQAFESSSKQLTFEDLVIEEQIPDIGTLGLNLMSLFQPRRALHPERKERKKIQVGTSLIEASANLVVNVVRATNLPMKRAVNSQGLSTEALTGISLFKQDVSGIGGGGGGGVGSLLSPVKPFVEISFKRTSARTITSVGTNPIWNQEIQLPLPAPASLAQTDADDNIYILVYDEVEIDILEDDRRRETDIHRRLEKRWLGSVTIPFSTLYVNGRIEGTFKLNSPSILLGYEYQAGGGSGVVTGAFDPASTRQPLRKHSQSQNQEFSLGSPNYAFITFFITLQPAISPTMTTKRPGSSAESPEILALVQTWESKILQRYPERKLNALVMNSIGETVLATRYLQAIEPPGQVLGYGYEQAPVLETMFSIAHFVSLFPTARAPGEVATTSSLWLPADTFAAMPGGGVDEQAILLACFFLYLEIPTWLLFGNAVLDGPTTYVFTSFKGVKKDEDRFKEVKGHEMLIWNPSTGECFNVNGTFCPLQQVWSIIGKANIWGNVSTLESPQHLDWNFEKSNQWQPLFSKSVDESKLPSVQPIEHIRYEKVDKTKVARLAQQIERSLKESFMIWRKTSKTSWNRHCSAILKRILPKLELRKVGRLGPMEVGSSSDLLNPGSLRSAAATAAVAEHEVDDESLAELRDVVASYQMTGFPLQQCYTSIDTITETVYATSLHSIDTPNVEFALAVYVKGYPANVFSVWIYLAALHKQK